MSNYPPGAKHDSRAPYNQTDHSHKHEWRPIDGLSPIIEDGAAIFHDECTYAEGRYGEGWECDEARAYRFEYSHINVLGGGEIQLPDITEWEKTADELEEVVIAIEEAYHDDDDRVDVSIDPDKEGGQVAIEFLGYTLVYEP